MSIFAFDVITTHDCTAVSTGYIETGRALTDNERNILSRASLGGRIMPRIICTAVAGSGSFTISDLSYSTDGGTRYQTGQAITIAVSGTGSLATSSSEITCMIPRDVTHIKWGATTETLAAGDYCTVILQLVCMI